MVQVIEDLEAYDDLKEEVSALYEQKVLQEQYTTKMEEAATTERKKSIACRDEVGVLLDVVNLTENKLKDTKAKLRRTKTWYTIALGVLVGALIVK